MYSATYLSAKIEEIASFPERLRVVVTNLIEEQLDTNYRNEGWTVRQVIHHCAESHMNCYIRIKWALTENNPVIKSYDENLWSTLDDSIQMPIQPSLSILDGLHYRLAYIMRNLSITDLEKSFIHPESGATVKIKHMIGTYAWHSNHHLAHITELKRRKNWK
ncbi:YfiT family bacillithiol transferase [Flavobacterium sp. 28A]|uniref:YfiT family bacillithiol transferase n=1 Tax=Flavobacterium sp. 28A TaxID=2735895 RepID=UPI00353025F2